MSDPEIPPQASFFYENGWSAYLDRFMLDGLIMRKRWEDWRSQEVPNHVVAQIHKELNFHYQVSFTVHEVITRLQFLQKRYNTFKTLVHPKARTSWDHENNTVTVQSKTWRKIFKEDVFNMAYYWNGEPEMRNLCGVFGMHETSKQESGNSVIVISDSDDVVEVTQPGKTPLSDEVNTPAPTTAQARRRLFSGENAGSDQCSSNMAYASGFHSPNAIPVHYVLVFQDAIAGDTGSYCAPSPYSPITPKLRKPE